MPPASFCRPRITSWRSSTVTLISSLAKPATARVMAMPPSSGLAFDIVRRIAVSRRFWRYVPGAVPAARSRAGKGCRNKLLRVMSKPSFRAARKSKARMGAKAHEKKWCLFVLLQAPIVARSWRPPARKYRRETSGLGGQRRVKRHALRHHPARHFRDLGFGGLGGGARRQCAAVAAQLRRQLRRAGQGFARPLWPKMIAGSRSVIWSSRSS